MITRDSRVDLISAKLHGIDKNIDLFMKRKGKLVSQDNSGQVSNVDHDVLYCNGLLALLCTTINFDNALVVWNPYWGKTRWIKRPKGYIDRLAFGYDKSCGSHKILNICNHNHEIYDLNSSSSWRFLDVTLDKNIALSAKDSVSLKENTSWFARDDEQEGYYFLVCFDFTRERFGPRLPLPFHCDNVAYVSLSTVRDEKLAVLLHRCDDFEIEIWVTSKIEPDAVSWSCFLKVEIMRICVRSLYGNFFIEEEKKVAVIFYETYSMSNLCCIIRENGFFRRVDFRNFPYIQRQVRRSLSSYVPTSVQI